MITVGSCFSGIGGLELGLERTGGFKTKWQIEINDYASKVLEKHWPNVKRYRDIRDVSFPKRVDLICGGFPCQDVSLAGKRAGLGGNRSTLWSEMFRLVCEVKPRWVLAENVPGLLSSDDGRFFGNILRNLASAGYYAGWDLLSASEVGAPHNRKRLFIVANTNGKGFSGFRKPYANTIPCDEKTRQSIGGFDYDYEVGFPNIPQSIRMDDGIPNRMDRVKCLGNAVVPQVAQRIGEMILESEMKFDINRRIK